MAVCPGCGRQDQPPSTIWDADERQHVPWGDRPWWCMPCLNAKVTAARNPQQTEQCTTMVAAAD